MAIFFPGSKGGQFSWIEYQALMLCLAGVIVTSLVFAEIALNRFQVLPLLFPGMFRVQERRFYFFNFDISDGTMGKKIRAEAKMVVRMTICLVLSYLWQHCVLETTQQVGTDFPHGPCDLGADCFASRFHFYTVFNRQYEAVDCKQPAEFDKRVVVSCIRFIHPQGTVWLMHLAISHSITQLNFKAFELMVWIGGNSKWSRRLIGVLIFGSLCSLIALFFSGILSEFVSSWLSFIMSLTIPMFLHTTYKAGKHLELLWRDEAIKVQAHIEENLSGAFADIESTVNLEIEDVKGVQREISQDRAREIREREEKKSTGKVVRKLRSMKSALANNIANPLRRTSAKLQGTESREWNREYSRAVYSSDGEELGSADGSSLVTGRSGDESDKVRDKSKDTTDTRVDSQGPAVPEASKDV